MSVEEKVVSLNLLAGANLSASQYRFVYISAANTVLLVATAGVQSCGILQNEPAAAGRSAEVAISGRVKVYAGATVTAGAKLTSDATGRAVIAQGEDEIMGEAVNAGVVGEVIEILLNPQGKTVQPLLITDSGAGVTVSTFVTVAAAGTVRTAVLYEAALGVATATALAAATVSIQTGGTVAITAGETVTAGDLVAPMALGRAKTVDHVRDVAAGVALNTATVGLPVTVLLLPIGHRAQVGQMLRIPTDVQTAAFGVAVDATWEDEDLVTLLNAQTTTDMLMGSVLLLGVLEIITGDAVAHTVLWADGGTPAGIDKVQTYTTPNVAGSYFTDVALITDATGNIKIQADVAAQVTFRFHVRGYMYVQNDAIT